MSQHRLTRRIFSAMYGLPPRRLRELDGDLDLRIRMPDGVDLLADRWAPAELAPDTPTVLVRTCYDRRAFWSLAARAYAERGFQTVVVNSRGTFGSGGGPFYPMESEHDDGLAVLTWVRAQPWYRGSLILAGASYLGYTQWAVAADAPADVIAMHPHLTSARLAQNFATTGATELDTAARWSFMTATQERRGANARIALGVDRHRIEVGLNTLPINIVDSATIGEPWPFFQDTIDRLEDDPRWDAWNRSVDVHRVRIPASFVAGWYDAFLVDELHDYRTLTEAGTPTSLTIGPWTHMSFGASARTVRDTLAWGGMHAPGAGARAAAGRTDAGADAASSADAVAHSGSDSASDSDPVPHPAAVRAPVRVFVMGAGEWQEFDSWPPRDAVDTPWYLAPDGHLKPRERSQSVVRSVSETADSDLSREPSRYRYDPADPTPSVGGRLLLTGAGRKSNRALEARSDVLTFTSAVLDEDVRVIGDISAEIWMSSSRPTWDLFVRVCDVSPRGRSENVTDGLIRVTISPGEQSAQPRRIRLALAPTAQLFARGHRIRVQISSGAHPRFARNLGIEDEQFGATEMVAADQAVFHDASHPSAVWLPVLP